jgi:outer membrane protein OmpA-like peptidoglycan-associated protein
MYKMSKLLIGPLALTLVTAGCVGKGRFREHVETNDARVGDVENAVEENERRLTDLKGDTDQKITAVRGRADQAMSASERAMSRAEEAGDQAEDALRGRLLWEIALTDDSVKFGFDGVSLTPEAMAELDQLSQQVKGLDKAVYLEIEGHTDSSGSETYNRTLGERRAEAVMVYLNQQGGIPLHAMNTISYGESQPIADNGTRDGRSTNRRVVVKVLE